MTRLRVMPDVIMRSVRNLSRPGGIWFGKGGEWGVT